MNNALRLEVNAKLKRNNGLERSLRLPGELSKCHTPRPAWSRESFFKNEFKTFPTPLLLAFWQMHWDAAHFSSVAKVRRLSLPSAWLYRTRGEISLEMIMQKGMDVYVSTWGYSGTTVTLLLWSTIRVWMKAPGGGLEKEDIRIEPSLYLTFKGPESCSSDNLQFLKICKLDHSHSQGCSWCKWRSLIPLVSSLPSQYCRNIQLRIFMKYEIWDLKHWKTNTWLLARYE